MQYGIKIKSKLLSLDSPMVMGILNVTNDSFFDGGLYSDDVTILSRVDQMVNEGVDIVDIGACSTRPGATLVSEDEELKQLSNALANIRRKYPDLLISVDTFRANIASTVVNEFDVNIINDISAGTLDNKMFETVADLQVPYVLMHMKGRPETMQDHPRYGASIEKEVVKYLSEKVHHLRKMGVDDIILDPGFGFGKTLEDNYFLLDRLDDFSIFDLPILVGVSRKSMIYKLLEKDAAGALNGTTALNMYALTKGAAFLRVHDVKEAVETVKVFSQLNNG